MKPRQIPWKWLLLGLITLLIAGLAILPRLLADSTQLASRVTDALSAWTGGEVKLTGHADEFLWMESGRIVNRTTSLYGAPQ